MHRQVGVEEGEFADVDLVAEAVGAVGHGEQPLHAGKRLPADQADFRVSQDSPGPGSASAVSQRQSTLCT